MKETRAAIETYPAILIDRGLIEKLRQFDVSRLILPRTLFFGIG
jgi:hypothetical protein